MDKKQAQRLQINILDAYGSVRYTKSEFFQIGNVLVALPEGLVSGMYWNRVLDVFGNSFDLRWLVI